MSNAAICPAPWLPRNPERLRTRSDAEAIEIWRRVSTPFKSTLLWRRRATKVMAAVVAEMQRCADLSDNDLASRVLEVRRGLSRPRGYALWLPQALALAGQISKRKKGLEPYPEQLLAAWAMMHGHAVEMHTGEGKTLAIALAAASLALAHRHVHVVTSNDYLAQRDATEMQPLYMGLGLSVAAVTPEMIAPVQRAAAWRADVVYSTNKTVVFDYLRDGLTLGTRRHALHREIDALEGRGAVLQGGLDVALIDEADSVLVDECRTPLILSRQIKAPYESAVYEQALAAAAQLRKDEHFIIESASSGLVSLTDAGRAQIDATLAQQKPFDLRRRREELLGRALAALHCYRRDVQYLVRDEAVQIIDSNTGRVLADRSWENGLQQLVEVKEGCKLTGGRETISRITYQRFFARYRSLGAATGTAREVANELWRVYGLRVTPIPRNKPARVTNKGRQLVSTRAAHAKAILDRIADCQSRGQPVLVGTRTLAASNEISSALQAMGITHEVLNASQDAREAQIISLAGQPGRVTVATNMAGRGTDIKLMSGSDAVGGLHVVATALNESSRLERQLFGRAGRQGEPGSYEAILCTEDELLRPTLRKVAMSLQAGAWRRFPKLSRLLVNTTVAVQQRLLEMGAARQRFNALSEDRRADRAMTFAGLME